MRKRRILRRLRPGRSLAAASDRMPGDGFARGVPDFGFDLPPFDRYTHTLPVGVDQHRKVILIFSGSGIERLVQVAAEHEIDSGTLQKRHEEPLYPCQS